MKFVIFFAFLVATGWADVSEIKTSSERQYLPPLESSPHSKNDHHEKDKPINGKNYNDGIEPPLIDQKHDTYIISKPKAVPDPPAVAIPRSSLHTFVTDLPIRQPLFVPAGSDGVQQAQGSDHVLYATAPNSVFHTQINVQSQGSEFNVPNAEPDSDSAQDGRANNANYNGFRDDSAYQSKNDRYEHIGHPRKQTQYSHETEKTYQRTYHLTTKAPRNYQHDIKSNHYDHSRSYDAYKQKDSYGRTDDQQVRRPNYQGVNLINGNIAADQASRLPQPPDNFNGNTQGINVINGNLLGSDGQSRQYTNDRNRDENTRRTYDYHNEKPKSYEHKNQETYYHEHKDQRQYDHHYDHHDVRNYKHDKVDKEYNSHSQDDNRNYKYNNHHENRSNKQDHHDHQEHKNDNYNKYNNQRERYDNHNYKQDNHDYYDHKTDNHNKHDDQHDNRSYKQDHHDHYDHKKDNHNKNDDHHDNRNYKQDHHDHYDSKKDSHNKHDDHHDNRNYKQNHHDHYDHKKDNHNKHDDHYDNRNYKQDHHEHYDHKKDNHNKHDDHYDNRSYKQDHHEHYDHKKDNHNNHDDHHDSSNYKQDHHEQDYKKKSDKHDQSENRNYEHNNEHKKQHDHGDRNEDNRRTVNTNPDRSVVTTSAIKIIAFNNNNSPQTQVPIRTGGQNTDFEIVSSASVPELIYKAGDEIDFAETKLIDYADNQRPLESYSYERKKNPQKNQSDKHGDTDLREDGYHYTKPSISFNS